MQIKIFTFNPFEENTYILYDDSQECVIVDPGCNNASERLQITEFITNNALQPKYLINTHCHIDHILGNKFISDTYGLSLSAHKQEAIVLEHGIQVATMYQIPYDPSPTIANFLEEGDTIVFGNTKLHVIFTPGHSPASITLHNNSLDILIVGDVLFDGSIGRTDLPGGNFETLTRVIKSKLLTLKDETKVYPGHGPSTTIGKEKRTNPYF